MRDTDSAARRPIGQEACHSLNHQSPDKFRPLQQSTEMPDVPGEKMGGPATKGGVEYHLILRRELRA